MKIVLQILAIFSFISVQAQYTLSDDVGNPIADGDVITVTYDATESNPEAHFDVNVLSENNNDFRFEIVSTDQGENASNWVCTNFGTCYSPASIDIEVQLLGDNTRELQLHYSPNEHPEDAIVNYRITEVGNNSNTISFSMKYVGSSTLSISEQIIDKSSFLAYPNTSNQSAQINYNVKENSNIYIFNTLGEIVEITPVRKGKGHIKIDTSVYREGTYIYQIVTMSNEKSSKILIVKH